MVSRTSLQSPGPFATFCVALPSPERRSSAARSIAPGAPPMTAAPRAAEASPELLSHEIYLDPHPHIHRLRAQAPVHWSRSLQSWLLTRYDDVAAALRDPRFGHTGAQRRMSRL